MNYMKNVCVYVFMCVRLCCVCVLFVVCCVCVCDCMLCVVCCVLSVCVCGFGCGSNLVWVQVDSTGTITGRGENFEVLHLLPNEIDASIYPVLCSNYR